MTQQPYLAVQSIAKHYPGGVRALAGVDLTVTRGEIVCLLGPSGCGKTTLLRIVAGLEQPDHGHVMLDGRDLASIPVHRRGFGLMFQDFALFPHRSVAENVAFGLRMAGWKSRLRAARVEEMLALVNLPGYGPRSVLELSGGERQRVALARSLAPRPSLLMLDEPLGSLDRGLREALVEELRAILKEMDVTALYVTHDQDEALALADRIAIMRQGEIEQVADPVSLYTHPATPFVARFMGFSNLLPAEVVDDSTVMTPLGAFPTPGHNTQQFPVRQTLLIRPEAARLDRTDSIPMRPGFHTFDPDRRMVALCGMLNHSTYHGSHYRVQIDVPGDRADVQLAFQLPTFQRDDQRGVLTPNYLPEHGAMICLRIYIDLTTLLPYSTA